MALSPELLIDIFPYALPPSFLLHPICSFSPCSPWLYALRQKKALSLVCRTWNPIATCLLYEEINIRRLCQLDSLLKTLQARPDLGLLTKRLVVTTVVPDEFLISFNFGLSLIQEFCPGLSCLTLSAITQPLPKAASIATYKSSLCCLPRLKVLDLSEGVFMGDLYGLIRECVGLEKLYFKEVSDRNPISDLDRHVERRVITLPRLVSLHSNFESSAEVMQFVNLVVLPNLLSLTLTTPYMSDQSKFCAIQGKNLSYLHLPKSCDKDTPKECPNLRHLVLPSRNALIAVLQSLERDTIEYADVWVKSFATCDADFDLSDHLDYLAHFRHLRYLDVALSTHPDLPQEFPPQDQCLYNNKPRRLQYSGIDIEITKDYITRCDLLDLDTLTDEIYEEYTEDVNARLASDNQKGKVEYDEEETDCVTDEDARFGDPVSAIYYDLLRAHWSKESDVDEDSTYDGDSDFSAHDYDLLLAHESEESDEDSTYDDTDKGLTAEREDY